LYLDRQMSNRFLAVSCRPSSLVSSISSGGEKVDDCISLPYVESETRKTVRPEKEKRKEERTSTSQDDAFPRFLPGTLEGLTGSSTGNGLNHELVVLTGGGLANVHPFAGSDDFADRSLPSRADQSLDFAVSECLRKSGTERRALVRLFTILSEQQYCKGLIEKRYSQKKLDVVFESARGCQGMVLQLVFNPLNCLQYGHLHLTQNLPLISSCESSSTRSCGQGPCGTSCTWWLLSCQCQFSSIRVHRCKRTEGSRDEGGVVGVQHVLGVGAL
jgi:hypothetical protein